MEELEALRAALSSPNQSGKSEVVEKYERDLASHFGAAHAVALNSGSAALEASLSALGACAGKSILVSAAAPLPTLMPLLATGASIRFVDSSPDSPRMNAADLERCLDQTVVAAVEVPLWGYPLDYSPVLPLLSEAGIPLIEDAAHAHGAHVDGKFVGTFGAAGCFSTHQMKPLSTGEGGFVLTDDPEIESRVRRYSRIGNLDGTSYGRNFKPSAFTAAVGIARLAHLSQKVRDTRAAAISLLERLPEELSLEADHIGVPNGYNLVVNVASRERARNFHQSLADVGVRTDPIMYNYKVGYKHSLFRGWVRHCPNAEALTEKLVQLPTRTTPTSSLLRSVAAAWANVS